MHDLSSCNSLFVGQLYKGKSLALCAYDLIFTTDLQTVNYYSTKITARAELSLNLNLGFTLNGNKTCFLYLIL